MRSSILLCAVLSLTTAVFAESGKPFDETGGDASPGVWDLSRPLWVFFAQERALVPESPLGEVIPRAAAAHYRPVGENKRWFFILAGIAYLANFHVEASGLESEASVFTMLMPVGSSVYRDGAEVPEEEMESSWTDVSLRTTHMWGRDARVRLGADYQLAWRDYRTAEDTDPAFVLPEDTFVHALSVTAALDTRKRGCTGDYNRGVDLEAGLVYEMRTDWSAWGVSGTEFTDPDAKKCTTLFGSFEAHKSFDERDAFVLHLKLRAARGWDLDRLTYIRLGGGGFGRQFDRVGAGSTGAANDGELLRSDGIPGYFGGEFFTDRHLQVNFEMDFPAGPTSRLHLFGAGAHFKDLLSTGAPYESIYGFGIGYTRVFNNMTRGFRVDLGYAPEAERDGGSAEFTITYLQLF